VRKTVCNPPFSIFYRWRKEFFENGAAAFQAKVRPARPVEER
jgi:hypothetical protein